MRQALTEGYSPSYSILLYVYFILKCKKTIDWDTRLLTVMVCRIVPYRLNFIKAQ